MHRNKSQTVTCPNCLASQTEINLSDNDKFAWRCDNCLSIIENGQIHLLQNIAGFTAPTGGNMCTGFGGRLGAINHAGLKTGEN
jgi:hypothetical protein